MSFETLHKLFKPKSIAVIGASRDPKKLGNIILLNIINGGFVGKIFPINPEAKEIHGLKAYPSVLEVSEDIDLAVVTVPAQIVPKVLEDCGKKNIKVVIIISAGFKETGPEGEILEQKVMEIGKMMGIRILGPNCLGIVNASERIDATISRVIDPKQLKEGSIAFVSQSGAFGASLYSWAQGKGISFDKLISFGNMCDIDESDIIAYLASDENTKVIVMYLEGVKDGRKFLETAKKVSLKKPIVVMKIGRSSRGSQAAKSHTGALTGASAIYDAAFKQAGIIKASSTTEMFDFGKAFATQPLPKGNGIVIVTNAGGPGVAATDVCEDVGLDLVEIDEETRKVLKKLLPPFASTLNPIDTTPQVSPKVNGKILKIVLSLKKVHGAISIIVGSKPRQYAEEVVSAHLNLSKEYNKPVLLSWTADKSAEDLIIKLEQNGVPVYETPERAVRSMAALRKYATFLEKHL
ncbi:MAG: CoA-binding protein [Candidatus Bathyarchaeia archaeon]